MRAMVWSDSAAVYPRVCGGTACFAPRVVQVCGLSPRVRGNRAICRYGYTEGRSIPACAGEPRGWSLMVAR